MDDWMIVAVSLALGGMIPVAVEWVRGTIERYQRRQDQYYDFQRQTLHELQDALYRFIQGLTSAKEDYLAIQEGRVPPLRVFDNPRLILPEAAARIVLLAARVDDEVLRAIVKEYRETAKTIFLPNATVADEVAFERLDKLWELQGLANDRIGDLLRSL